MSNKLNAEWVYYILSGAAAFFDATMFTVLTVYYFKTVGLNPLQLVLVGTVLESTCFLFETPTGVVADTYSRRLSVILGMFLLGAAFVLVGAVPTFAFVLLGQVISGVGYTFLSGATDAWLADEVLIRNGEASIARIYLRSGQFNRLLSLAGTVTSVALASIALQLPIVLGGALYLVLGFFLLLTMPEHGFTPTPRAERAGWKTMIATFRGGVQVVRRSSTLMLLLAVNVIAGAASEGFDRLGDAHLLANFTFPALGTLKPVVWFGIINAVGSLFSLLVVQLLRRRMEKVSRQPTSAARFLLALNTLTVVSIVAFGVAGNFPMAVAALLFKGALASLFWPLYNAWLIQHINNPAVRATVLSMLSQGNAFGQIAGGPGVGWVGKRFSLRAAIVLAGLLLAPASLLYARASREAVIGNPVN